MLPRSFEAELNAYSLHQSWMQIKRVQTYSAGAGTVPYCSLTHGLGQTLAAQGTVFWPMSWAAPWHLKDTKPFWTGCMHRAAISGTLMYSTLRIHPGIDSPSGHVRGCTPQNMTASSGHARTTYWLGSKTKITIGPRVETFCIQGCRLQLYGEQLPSKRVFLSPGSSLTSPALRLRQENRPRASISLTYNEA